MLGGGRKKPRPGPGSHEQLADVSHGWLTSRTRSDAVVSSHLVLKLHEHRKNDQSEGISWFRTQIHPFYFEKIQKETMYNLCTNVLYKTVDLSADYIGQSGRSTQHHRVTPAPIPPALTRLLRQSPARHDGNAPTDPICDKSHVLNSS